MAINWGDLLWCVGSVLLNLGFTTWKTASSERNVSAHLLSVLMPVLGNPKKSNNSKSKRRKKNVRPIQEPWISPAES